MTKTSQKFSMLVQSKLLRDAGKEQSQVMNMAATKMLKLPKLKAKRIKEHWPLKWKK
jgi:hypothetical protein